MGRGTDHTDEQIKRVYHGARTNSARHFSLYVHFATMMKRIGPDFYHIDYYPEEMGVFPQGLRTLELQIFIQILPTSYISFANTLTSYCKLNYVLSFFHFLKFKCTIKATL